jgi:hypothetical protein
VEQANPNAQGEEVVRTFSFDYSSQTTSASTVITDGEAFGFEATTPIVVNVWNRTGRGFISKTGITGEEAAPPQGVVVVYPRILLSETREMRAGIVRINKTAQFIYE